MRYSSKATPLPTRTSRFPLVLIPNRKGLVSQLRGLPCQRFVRRYLTMMAAVCRLSRHQPTDADITTLLSGRCGRPNAVAHYARFSGSRVVFACHHALQRRLVP